MNGVYQPSGPPSVFVTFGRYTVRVGCPAAPQPAALDGDDANASEAIATSAAIATRSVPFLTPSSIGRALGELSVGQFAREIRRDICLYLDTGLAVRHVPKRATLAHALQECAGGIRHDDLHVLPLGC